ncbi:MAG TPA: hypothetical protein VGC27_00405 [Rhizomicrobium sp.]
MKLKKLLLTVAAAAVLSSAGAGMALAAPHDRGGHHDSNRGGDRRDGYRHDSNRVGHDRYWRKEYRHGYVDHKRVFVNLRKHHYTRFVGNPYWYQGRYVVRSYDRVGRVVFVEVNPYTGGFVGVIRF